jgi:hypothetical protein
MFTEYASSVFDVIDKHDKKGHGYADDHQVYNSFHTTECNTNVTSMENCVGDIRSWMRSMKLKMNDSKTEYIIFGTQHQLSKCPKVPIKIGEASIEPADVVCNLGAHLDKNLSMEEHIKRRCRAAYGQLYNIAKIRDYLDDDSAQQLIHALVHSHIDYCNVLLIGLPQYLIKKMQMVQNSAARVLCRLRKYDRISKVLKELHWLPVAYRIRFKLCVLVFKALHDLGPEYLKDMLTVRNTGLRSSDTLTLVVPRTKLKVGDRAFAVSGPREWNSLPAKIRDLSDLGAFKRKLKHHYFQMAYK